MQELNSDKRIISVIILKKIQYAVKISKIIVICCELSFQEKYASIEIRENERGLSERTDSECLI